MQSNKNINIFLGILAVIILVIIFIYTRSSGAAEVTSGLVAENTEQTSDISAFLRKMSAIKDVRLDISVFENPVLKNGLRDSSQDLVPEDKGRTNPFAPINSAEVSAKENISNLIVPKITVPVNNVPVAPVTPVAPKKVLSD